MTTLTEATLPQLNGGTFITEAGLETDLIFNHGIDLPEFASFPLLDTEDGTTVLHDYYTSFLDVARRDASGALFETPTWRSSADWGASLGYAADDLDRLNQAAVRLLRTVRDENPDVTIVVSGNLGPRGDGYVVGDAMTPNEAAAYHAPQIRSLLAAGADLITALTVTYVDEGVGIAMAATEADAPVVISFTVETDGRLPSGETLAEAIERVDAATNGAPAYFMVNCAHPTHFAHVFEQSGPWHRIRGIRANASTMSHEELDNATELDRGDVHDLAHGYAELRKLLPDLVVVGGCCGTDHAHIDAIGTALTA